MSAWEQTPFPARTGARGTWALHDAGWTPRAVCTLAGEVVAQDGASTSVTFYSLVKDWARAMHPVEASRFIEMGVGLDGARALQARGEIIDAATFATMSALRGDDSLVRYLSEPQRGRSVSPYHRPRKHAGPSRGQATTEPDIRR